MRRRSQESDSLNLSFLDAISCGLGAIILLLVIVLLFAPVKIRETREQVQARIAAARQELASLAPVVDAKPPPPTDLREQLVKLQSDFSTLRGQFAASKSPQVESDIEGGLRTARQQLTEEMRRLLANYKPPAKDAAVAGIPVDSEYIVFVIDTSGSMFQGPWDLVLKKVGETLAVYPRIKGIQVLNDEGKYMFSSYAGKWIPDSASNRRNIISRLANWNPYSDSSPVEGITEAINTFYEPGRKISLFVYGDDFPRGQVEAVARFVDRTNGASRGGERLVRIHGVGFPTQLAGGQMRNAQQFANLMRTLCERNGGTFVALTTL
jgi:Sec-independent protein translocase protein TatA